VRTSDRLRESVTGSDKDGWDFACPVTDGTCGAPGGPAFASTGWPSRTIAEARGLEHFTEHRTGADPDAETVPMSTLEDFRGRHGLTPTENGARAVVTAKDL
jgi:hypothetical protein